MEKDNLHTGHRARLRKKLMEIGYAGLEEHEIMELVLFYFITRQNTNPLAHTLIDKFGTFANVLEADVNDLKLVPGISDHIATGLTLLPMIGKSYYYSKLTNKTSFKSFNNVINYLKPLIASEQTEISVIILLDSHYKLIKTRMFSSPSASSTNNLIKLFVKEAINSNAVNAIIAHNHPSQVAEPSLADKKSTYAIYWALKYIDVNLLDHIIVGGDNSFSFLNSGELDNIRKTNAGV